METNWNQLIERYLQNELSEEGKTAFEQELETNEQLREELELHELVQSAAKRASQRVMVQQAGKSYFRNLRIKQFTIATVVTIAATVGIVYWVQHEQADKDPESENHSEATPPKQNRQPFLAPKLTGQPAFSGDKRLLIHSSDSCVNEPEDAKYVARVVPGNGANVSGNTAGRTTIHTELRLQNAPQALPVDSVDLPKPTTVVLGYTGDKSHREVKEADGKGTPEWARDYDSIGKFNELYCGYALVMDQSKFGFVDNNGKVFIPLVYDQIIVTTNIKSSKQKNKRSKKKILYIPKRSGRDVKDCDENYQLKMGRL